ncbi:hypothetical protein G1H11_20560 [Phytoactinopolyspora alkaliphila]|uniref:Uncharacterized protein n=1 Tax=Phytoactinopolyspora alkaliphila TaxID=1783498 RepID=A0A6N9YRX1_9ACTN|nr:hypothetical protein [Phytoactinopolyspora alkaliphila]NED97695.1 hypothetical protein [Phytoactinopolyspora alkaliphila]
MDNTVSVDGLIADENHRIGLLFDWMSNGDACGRVLAAGLVDQVTMDVLPVVFRPSIRCFGSIDSHPIPPVAAAVAAAETGGLSS